MLIESYQKQQKLKKSYKLKNQPSYQSKLLYQLTEQLKKLLLFKDKLKEQYKLFNKLKKLFKLELNKLESKLYHQLDKNQLFNKELNKLKKSYHITMKPSNKSPPELLNQLPILLKDLLKYLLFLKNQQLLIMKSQEYMKLKDLMKKLYQFPKLFNYHSKHQSLLK